MPQHGTYTTAVQCDTSIQIYGYMCVCIIILNITHKLRYTVLLNFPHNWYTLCRHTHKNNWKNICHTSCNRHFSFPLIAYTQSIVTLQRLNIILLCIYSKCPPKIKDIPIPLLIVRNEAAQQHVSRTINIKTLAERAHCNCYSLGIEQRLCPLVLAYLHELYMILNVGAEGGELVHLYKVSTPSASRPHVATQRD